LIAQWIFTFYRSGGRAGEGLLTLGITLLLLFVAVLFFVF
jgi:hypothetical protein